MLYNHHLEPISTSMSVGPLRISTPPYTPHNLRSSIKPLSFTALLSPPGRAHSRRRPVPRVTPVSMHILKICRSSLLSHKCDRVKSYLYHATGTVRPNLNQDLPRNTVPKRPVSDPTPLMHIRLPPLSPPHSPATDAQNSLPSFTKPYTVASSKTPDITSVF